MEFLEEEYEVDEFVDNDLQFSDSGSDENINGKHSVQEEQGKRIYNQKTRRSMINSRSFINRVKETAQGNFERLEKLKGELELCTQHIMELKKEEELTEAAIANNKREENIAAVFRLQGQLKRINIELEGEEELRKIIEANVTKAEIEYTKCQLAEGDNLINDIELQQKELDFEKHQERMTEKRVTKETKLTENSRRSKENMIANIKMLEQDKKRKAALNQRHVQKAHEKHSKYFNDTIKRIRDQNAQIVKNKTETDMKKVESFNKLNADISQIKDNLSALCAKRNADQAIELKKEDEIRQSVLEKGGNPNLEIKKYRNAIKLAKEKEEFAKSVKLGQMKVVEKIEKEEENMKRKLKLMPCLFGGKAKPFELSTHELRNIIPDKDTPEQNTLFMEQLKENVELWETWDKRSDAGESSIELREQNGLENSDGNTVGPLVNSLDPVLQNVVTEDDDFDTNINQPEFQGMWDVTVQYRIPKVEEYQPVKTKNASKMDQDIMNRVLKQLKENIVRPQIVNGRVFKGQSFNSKPEIIKFEDLVVGESYSQKVVLTNTSYAINSCRYELMSENLRDFVSVKFLAPGPLSPGMTCDFIITFEPKIDEDLFGELYFTGQTERFSIPVVCLTKKCKMSTDKQLIQFDTTIIGETLVQAFTLKNSGAKGTFCSIENEKNIKKDESDDMSTEIENSHEDDVLTKCIQTSLDGKKVWIDPFGEQEVIVKWNPIIDGNYSETYFVSFEDEDNKGFQIHVQGKALNIPVFIDDPCVVLNICMFERLYQETLIFHSRAPTALKLQFFIPNEVKEYLEILPNTGFIQAGQSFKAQLRLLTTETILAGNCPYFDAVTGILDIPIRTTIAGQVKTVDFNVQAVLTTTDMQLLSTDNDPKLLDFGYCTIKDTKIKTVKLINKSVLPQEFGFVGYPDFVEIQPNNGFGIILPKEEMEFYVMFSPQKAENYNFQIHCQSIIDRKFSLNCTATGVHPSLDISEQILSFPPTAIDDRSKVEIFVENNHLSTNIYTHEPPRIGSGDVFPVGPKTFQFLVDKDVPISFHPKSGSVNPGEKQRVTIYFQPKLQSKIIKQEAASILSAKLQNESRLKWEAEIKSLEALKEEADQKETTDGKTGKKSAKKTNKAGNDKAKDTLTLEQLIEAGPNKVDDVNPDQIEMKSDNFMKGKLSLMQKYNYQFELFKIKCIIAEGDVSSGTEKLKYNLENSLQLELHCPSIRPDLIVISNCGRPIVDFGQTISHRRIVQTLSVKNISNETIKLESSQLDPNGAFQICNALRELPSNFTTNIVVSFSAKEEGIYSSSWLLFGKDRNKFLKINFRATVSIPKLELKEVINGLYDCGRVLVNEFVEKTLTVINNSDLTLLCTFKFSSQEDRVLYQDLRNQNGLCIFDAVPHKCEIPKGKSQTITITFATDLESDRFEDTVKIFLFDNVEYCKFSITGQAKSSIMYLREEQIFSERCLDYLGEKWSLKASSSEETASDDKPPKGTAMCLQAKYTENRVVDGKANFLIGCVRTMAVSQKKNGEYSIDNMNVLTPLGFTVDPIKGQVESDMEKLITVSWRPPSTYEMGAVISATMIVTLKSDSSKVYNIDLRAFLD